VNISQPKLRSEKFDDDDDYDNDNDDDDDDNNNNNNKFTASLFTPPFIILYFSLKSEILFING